MKIFAKTLIFFISVIIFQSILTTFVITTITHKNNTTEAVYELKGETAGIFENYISWKRSIWKTLIELKNNTKLEQLIATVVKDTDKKPITSYLIEQFYNTGIDCFILKKSSSQEVDIIPVTYNLLTLPEAKALENTKSHPYISLQLLVKVLSMVGTVRLYSNRNDSLSEYIDLFVIKRLDDNFCRQITHGRRAKIAFFIETTRIEGTLEYLEMTPALNWLNLEIAYKEFYGTSFGGTSFNIAVQKLEQIFFDGAARDLYLITVLSNSPYIERIVLIRKIVLYVSLASACISLLLSLFFSRNITNPVKWLLNAMHRLQQGNYKTESGLNIHNEMGELFQGFNTMAQTLLSDKITMENYIHEITRLKDYNEKIINSLRAGIVIINENFEIEKVNSAFLSFFNLEPKNIIGKKLNLVPLEIIDTALEANVGTIIKKQKEYFSKIKRLKEKKIFEVKLYPFYATSKHEDEYPGCILIIEDISKKVEFFEEKIFQAEKLSTISILSAGVAHEINNPLGSIMTNVQNLLVDESDSEKKTSLNFIEQETRRIARTVQELLNFASTPQAGVPGACVNEVVSEVITLLDYYLSRDKKIAIKTSLEENPPKVAISKDELKQITINIAANSIQAIENQGDITIRTKFNKSGKRMAVSIYLRN
ncbi:MAG: histidine kinase dimerization/phospho-acceptor domain-containing protein [Spirochaetota bacterium]